MANHRSEIGWSLSNEGPEFAEVPTQRIDELGALAHEALVRSKCHRTRLMFSALDLDIMHARWLCSLRDRCQCRVNFPQKCRSKIPHLCRALVDTTIAGRHKPTFFKLRTLWAFQRVFLMRIHNSLSSILVITFLGAIEAFAGPVNVKTLELGAVSRYKFANELASKTTESYQFVLDGKSELDFTVSGFLRRGCVVEVVQMPVGIPIVRFDTYRGQTSSLHLAGNYTLIIYQDFESEKNGRSCNYEIVMSLRSAVSN